MYLKGCKGRFERIDADGFGAPERVAALWIFALRLIRFRFSMHVEFEGESVKVVCTA